MGKTECGTPEEAFAEAVRRAGGPVAVGCHFNIDHTAVASWKVVPAQRAIELERLTGISRHALRPDVYPRSAASEASDFDDQWTEARTENARLKAAIIDLTTKVADLTAENALLMAKIAETELAPEKTALSNWGPYG
jgi:DNA-binding transcriptional regulator YdaS (Cro superfamily)